MLGVVWYKHDLRLEDHLPLITALQECEEVIGVYNWHPVQEEAFLGIARWSEARKSFLLQNLQELQNAWKLKGSRLILSQGMDTNIFQSIQEQVARPIRVYTSKEAGSEEQNRVRKVEAHFDLVQFESHLLLDLDSLPFELKDIPKTFTPFRKAIEAHGIQLQYFPEPLNIPGIELSLKDDFWSLPARQLYLDPGQSGGEDRLQHYFWEVKGLSHYKETRNGMLGMDYSSHLSVYLSSGILSAGRIFREVKRYEEKVISNESTYWLIFELLWRDYFRLVHYQHKELFFAAGGIKGDKQLKSQDLNQFESWKQGKTGDDLVDACMRELNATGFMSNRGRQNAASYLIHDLNLDWRLGAAYFEQHLLDYDVSSNWGNWMYIAGVGNDPRPVRKFNTQRQAERYDLDQSFRKYWLK